MASKIFARDINPTAVTSMITPIPIKHLCEHKIMDVRVHTAHCNDFRNAMQRCLLTATVGVDQLDMFM